MAIDKVRAYFKQFGLERRIIELGVSSATVELAAIALHCEPERIAKTLSLQADTACLLVVAAGDAKIDNAKYKARFGVKPRMLAAEDVPEKVGHAVGGVCPFGINDGIGVYLDISMKRFNTVFPACGSASSAIELTIPELERYANSAGWVDVCKGWGTPELFM